MDVGGSKDLDGFSRMLVLSKIFVGSSGSGLVFLDLVGFSGDTAVFQAYDRSTHTYISTSRGC
jgi:hypothetical protein